MPDLLFELFSEEIPARMQRQAAEDLKRLVTDKLTAAGLTFERADSYVTPRRLALRVDGLPEKQPDVTEEKKGSTQAAPRLYDLTTLQREANGRFGFSAKTTLALAQANISTELATSAMLVSPWLRTISMPAKPANSSQAASGRPFSLFCMGF